MKNSALERLLHAASKTAPDQPNEMPFGFDTHVLAVWRSGRGRDSVGVGRLLQHVVLVCLAVIALASAGVYHDLRQSQEPGEPSFDQYEIADSAISSAVEP
jgi:hypothetical protein